MRVCDLRRALEGLPDDLAVALEVTGEDEDLVQADLHSATVEERCDEVPRLYLWGSQLEDGGT
jgi:hypothetical protein